jgi:predicted lipoprotein with Yx(FWY)xxD motif
MKTKQFFSLALFSLLVAGLLLGCKDDEEPKYSIKLSNSEAFGNILTDENGVTLYFFADDFDGTVRCTGSCLAAWPLFHAASLDNLAPELDKADFGEITANGQTVTTYKGWPLYYYAPAGNGVIEAPGQATGQTQANWYVVKYAPKYALMYSNTQLKGENGVNYKSDFTPGDGTTRYLTNDRGRTIYLFLNDRNGVNTYTAANAANPAWTPFYVDLATTSLPGTLQRTDFTEITVGTTKQLTFKGWPLYYFNRDAARGDNKGVSIGPAGGAPRWRVVNGNTPVAPN